jgi:hypothetical protein
MQRFERNFRLWEYRVGHDQLLLRSPKNAKRPRNFDVAFVGVEYLELPTNMRELVIGDPEEGDYEKASAVLGKAVPRDRVFVIQANEGRYVIVAAAITAFENDLDIFESSLERFG